MRTPKSSKSMTTTSRTTCKWCSEPLSADHTGPCPRCGKTGKNITMALRPAKLNITGHEVKTIIERRQEIIKENPKIKWITILVSIASIFLGGIFPPPFNIIIGLAAFFITYSLGPFVIKTIIIERDKS